MSETSGWIFTIQKPNESPLATDVHWFDKFTLRLQQEAQQGPQILSRMYLRD